MSAVFSGRNQHSQANSRRPGRLLAIRMAARGIALILLLALLLLAAWAAVAGPTTVWRVIRFGDTQIDDFHHYPARALSASAAPFRFAEDSQKEVRTLPVPLVDGSTTDLGDLLQASDTIAFLVLKNDRLVIERYGSGHSRSALSQSFSMAKSFSSLLVGQAIADGYFQSLDQPVTDFAPELAERGFSAVTLRHLLTMTSGSDYVENDNPFGEHVILNYTTHLQDEILKIRLEDAPGTVWRYKSGDNALLGLALSRALAPKTIAEYTQERLWTPLGMEYGGVWSLDDDGGLEKTWCCLAAAARDYLKLGRLVLNAGNWEGRQVVPADWIRQSTREGAIPAGAWDADYRRIGIWNYGLHWWLVSQQDGSALATGKDGQFLYVDPAQNVVILRLGWGMGKMPLSQWLGLFQYLAENLE